MALLRWQPQVDQFPDLFDEFNRVMGFLSRDIRAFVPALDVYQTPNEVIVEASLPGITPEDVRISIENDVLTIEGKSEHKSEVDEKEYFRKEVRIGSFHRTLALPAAVISDDAKAHYEKGILTITIPKEERTKPKTVKVEVRN